MMKNTIKKTLLITIAFLMLLSTSDITQITNEHPVKPLSDYDDSHQKYT